MRDYRSMTPAQMACELRHMAELAPTPALQECYQRAAALLDVPAQGSSQSTLTVTDKKLGKKVGEYLGMSGIDAEDVHYLRNLIASPAPHAALREALPKIVSRLRELRRWNARAQQYDPIEACLQIADELAALQPEAPAQDERLALARIIDPQAKFNDIEGVTWSRTEIQRRELAFSKADEILARRHYGQRSVDE